MAAQTPPPPPGSAASNPAQKKGMHPLAWVAIGCLVIIVLGGVVTAVGGFFVAKKAKELITEGDPAMTAAEAIVRLNPELELVDSDSEARKLIVRNTQTNEVATFDLSAIQEGRFEFEADGKEVTIDATGGGENLVTVTEDGGADGEPGTTSTLQIGTGGETPEWIPAYPGTEPTVLFSMTDSGVTNGSFQIETTDSLDTVLAFYETFAADMGREVDRSLIETNGRRMATLQTRASPEASSEDSSKDNGFSVVIQDEGEVRQATITYRGATP